MVSDIIVVFLYKMILQQYESNKWFLGIHSPCNYTHNYSIQYKLSYNLRASRDLHLIPMPNLKVFFLNTFQFTTQEWVCMFYARTRQFRNRN